MVESVPVWQEARNKAEQLEKEYINNFDDYINHPIIYCGYFDYLRRINIEISDKDCELFWLYEQARFLPEVLMSENYDVSLLNKRAEIYKQFIEK